MSEDRYGTRSADTSSFTSFDIAVDSFVNPYSDSSFNDPYDGRSNDGSYNQFEDLFIIARWTPDWLMSLSLSQYENLTITNKRNPINLFCKLNNKNYSK